MTQPFFGLICISFTIKLIKKDTASAKKFHGTFRFTDDLCALNDGGEFQKPHKKLTQGIGSKVKTFYF